MGEPNEDSALVPGVISPDCGSQLVPRPLFPNCFVCKLIGERFSSVPHSSSVSDLQIQVYCSQGSTQRIKLAICRVRQPRCKVVIGSHKIQPTSDKLRENKLSAIA